MTETPTPERPVDVFVVRRDTAERIPCELAYSHTDADGYAVWNVATEVDLKRGDTVEVGHVPHWTCIEFPLAGKDFGPVQP